jgi:hypothetical protein
MAELQPSKLVMRVRFPSPAPQARPCFSWSAPYQVSHTAVISRHSLSPFFILVWTRRGPRWLRPLAAHDPPRTPTTPRRGNLMDLTNGSEPKRLQAGFRALAAPDRRPRRSGLDVLIGTHTHTALIGAACPSAPLGQSSRGSLSIGMARPTTPGQEGAPGSQKLGACPVDRSAVNVGTVLGPPSPSGR